MVYCVVHNVINRTWSQLLYCCIEPLNSGSNLFFLSFQGLLTYLLLCYSSLEAYKEFQEECYSIALHPSGLYILVGFSDKLRLMNLLIDDIRSFKEFTIRGCREVTLDLLNIKFLSKVSFNVRSLHHLVRYPSLKSEYPSMKVRWTSILQW